MVIQSKAAVSSAVFQNSLISLVLSPMLAYVFFSSASNVYSVVLGGVYVLLFLS